MKRMTLGLMAMVSLVVGSAACAGGPPPKPAEEPIDTKASPAGASTNTTTATNDPPASTTETSAANSAADPSAGFTAPGAATTTPPPAGKGGKPAGKGVKEAAATPPPPAGKTGPIISAADCSKLTDKYVELVISGEGAPLRGTSGKELEQAREMVKASAASDPNFINMQKACVKEIHRSQYTCGMNARSAAEWQDCIR